MPWPEPPSNAACKATTTQLSEVMKGLRTPESPSPASQASSTHYCTFLLEDPLPLVVVLCIITVSGRAENGHMSYRVQKRVIPNTQEMLKEWVHPCPRHQRPGDGLGGAHTPARWSMLTFSACYSSSGVRGSGTGCEMWT